MKNFIKEYYVEILITLLAMAVISDVAIAFITK
jgi:hypothetical protein